MLHGDEREQELQALDLALAGIEACLERLPPLSRWRSTMVEVQDTIADVVHGGEEG